MFCLFDVFFCSFVVSCCYFLFFVLMCLLLSLLLLFFAVPAAVGIAAAIAMASVAGIVVFTLDSGAPVINCQCCFSLPLQSPL